MLTLHSATGALARRNSHLAPSSSLRSLAILPSGPSSFDDRLRKSLVTGDEGVHQTMKLSKNYRNKPLFRRQGDVRFKTGAEAGQLLVQEAMRRDSHKEEFISSVQSNLQCLSPIFDRNPKYAFVAKTLLEPERSIQFRVAWIDDTGIVRMNRGFRVQYSSSLGPYVGGLHFGYHITDSVVKTLAFDALFSNAVTGFDIGAAVGGADFHPLDKSEGEMQRFCQSYMTELSKYVGPEQDHPVMGMGVGPDEMGYMFGQYKRINVKANAAGRHFLSPDFYQVSCLHMCEFARIRAKSISYDYWTVLLTGSWIRRSVLRQRNAHG
jgi:glutamate dehydrogenase (NADP+)